ncbi:hypothetical protein QL285_026785 [Trifolium repens]|nr:hypothetical protein QL285_026785 [Trifolium repens]
MMPKSITVVDDLNWKEVYVAFVNRMIMIVDEWLVDLAYLPELDTLADKRMLFKMSHVDTDAECVEIGTEVVSDHKSKVVSLL